MLLTQLASLRDSTSKMFTIELRNIVYSIQYENIETEFYNILNDNKQELYIRFNAYYALSIFYRRGEHNTKYCELVEKYNELFISIFSLTHINLAFYYRYKSLGNNLYFSDAINEARKSVQLIKENPGVYQTFAELVVEAKDQGFAVEQKDLIDAIKYIEIAININDKYPRYYCTKARLFFYLGKYNQASVLLRKAIDLEKLDNNESLLRTSQYYFYLIEFKSQSMIIDIDRKVVKNKNILNHSLETNKKKVSLLLEELDSIKSKYLEFLAFFAAILAFIISTIQIVAEFTSFKEAAALLLILGGILNISFSTFRLIIDYKNERYIFIKMFIIILFGILMILMGGILGLEETEVGSLWHTY